MDNGGHHLDFSFGFFLRRQILFTSERKTTSDEKDLGLGFFERQKLVPRGRHQFQLGPQSEAKGFNQFLPFSFPDTNPTSFGTAICLTWKPYNDLYILLWIQPSTEPPESRCSPTLNVDVNTISNILPSTTLHFSSSNVKLSI